MASEKHCELSNDDLKNFSIALLLMLQYKMLIHRMFQGVDDFLTTASSIMNRRKSRTGRSLENHVERVFNLAQIPFEMRVNSIDGKPDLIVPGASAYFDENFPINRLFLVAIKTTCKDRWRQVLNEGRRVPKKHLVTIQQGISGNQLNEMASANVQLVVPKKLHRLYPQQTHMQLQAVDELISEIRSANV